MIMKRQQNKTSFITGEGIADRIFLTYLKDLYTERSIGHRITVHQASNPNISGGSSKTVMRNALLSCCKSSAFDAVVVLLDSDIMTVPCCELYSTAKRTVNKQKRHMIPSRYACIMANPCLEGLLLEALTGKTPPQHSRECKHLFITNFGKEAHRLTSNDYYRFLPKEKLDQASYKVPALNRLISFFKLSGNDDRFTSWFAQQVS